MVLAKFHLEYKKKRTFVLIFSVLVLLMIYFFQDSSFILRAISTVSLVLLFYVIDHFYYIKFRRRHYVFIIIIAILSFLLSPAYFVYPNYDKVQHFIQPMLVCSMVFFAINKLHLELKWKIVFTFFVVVAILGIFEMGEFALDSLFNLKLQGVYLRDARGFEKFNLLLDPLSDTMIDMALGILGSGIYCTVFAFVMRKKLQQNIFREF